MARRGLLDSLWYLALKYPIQTAILVVAVYYTGYRFLIKLPIAKEAIETITMVISCETGVVILHRQKKRLTEIVTRLLVTEGFCFCADQIIVSIFLRWKWSRQIIKGLGIWGREFMRDVKAIANAILPELKDGSGPVSRLLKRLSSARHDPAKVGLEIVFALGAVPRPPGFPIGGVSVGVLVVRYNKYGWRGWTMLISGILVRDVVWLAGVYGISAIWNAFF